MPSLYRTSIAIRRSTRERLFALSHRLPDEILYAPACLLRTCLLLAAIQPPRVRSEHKRRPSSRKDPVSTLPFHRSERDVRICDVLVPRHFATLSSAAEWAIVHHAEEALAFWSVLSDEEREEVANLLPVRGG